MTTSFEFQYLLFLGFVTEVTAGERSCLHQYLAQTS